MSRLDAYITANHRAHSGYSPLPNAPNDWGVDPALVEEAKAEVARLSRRPDGHTGPWRNLSTSDGGCHESKLRHDTLVRMLAELNA
jgi:hypothetical protein